MSPLLFVHKVVTPIDNGFIKMTICEEMWSSYEIKILFELFVTVIIFLIPVIIMSFCGKVYSL